MFRQIGWPEIVLILVVLLLVFGPSKLPQLAQSIGKTIREFRTGMAEVESEPEPPEGSEQAD